jgi:hypothetical protein
VAIGVLSGLAGWLTLGVEVADCRLKGIFQLCLLSELVSHRGLTVVDKEKLVVVRVEANFARARRGIVQRRITHAVEQVGMEFIFVVRYFQGNNNNMAVKHGIDRNREYILARITRANALYIYVRERANR